MSQSFLTVAAFAIAYLNQPLPVPAQQMTQIKTQLLQQRATPIAWRAGSLEARENSLSAVEQLVQLQYPYIHVDVRITQDQQFVLMADSTINRVTETPSQQKIEVSSIPYSQIPAFRDVIVSPYGQTYEQPQSQDQESQEKPPLLEQVLEALEQSQSVLFLEAHLQTPSQYQQLFTQLKKAQMLNRVVVIPELQSQSIFNTIRQQFGESVQLMSNQKMTDYMYQEFLSGAVRQRENAWVQNMFATPLPVQSNINFPQQTFTEYPEVQEQWQFQSAEATQPTQIISEYAQWMQQYETQMPVVYEKLQEKNIPVIGYVVDTQQEWEQAQEWGVNAVYTQRPAEFMVWEISQQEQQWSQQWTQPQYSQQQQQWNQWQ